MLSTKRALEKLQDRLPNFKLRYSKIVPFSDVWTMLGIYACESSNPYFFQFSSSAFIDTGILSVKPLLVDDIAVVLSYSNTSVFEHPEIISSKHNRKIKHNSEIKNFFWIIIFLQLFSTLNMS